MRRHVRRHPHRNPRPTIHQQVRKRRGKYRRFRQPFVIVRNKIHRVLLHVGHQCPTQRRHPRFRITHGGRRISFHRSKVPLRINQRLPHRPRLPHVHQRRINHRLTVRVIVPRGVTTNLRALHLLLRRIKPQLMHRIQDPPLRRLQSIPHIRQGTGNDDGHRIVQKRILDLLSDGDRTGIGFLH